jgi:DNA polymerase
VQAPAQTFAHYPLIYPDPPAEDCTAATAWTIATYGNCARCNLCDRRNRIAHIKGNPEAAVVVVGEGPGRDEDARGIPFVGRAGRLQEELFRECGIDPTNDVAWINLVGCRPCENRFTDDRPPTLVEKVACSERFLLMLRSIRPRVVICAGEQPTTAFFEKPPVQNTWHTFTAPDGDQVVIGVARHPAYLVRIVGIAKPRNYAEYFGAKLFYRELKRRLDAGITKVRRWPFGLRYLQDLTEPTVGV